MQYDQPMNAGQSLIARGDLDQPDGARPSPIRQLWDIVRKRKWIIGGCVIVALTLGVVITLMTTRLYTARTTIELQREQQNNFTKVQGAEAAQMIDPEFMETQIGLLRARSLAEGVATDLKLLDDPKFFEQFGVKAARDWFENGRLKAGAPDRNTRLNIAASILAGNIDVASARLSRIVTISFTSANPELSQRIVNAFGTRFIQASLDRRYAATAYARKFLEDRLGQLRDRINQAEQELVSYASAEGIVNLPSAGGTEAGGGGGERSLVAEDLIALNRELADATAARISAQSRLATNGGNVIEALSSGTITQLRARRAELSGQYAQMIERFEPAYPPAAAIRSQMAIIDRAIATEEGRVRSTLDQTYRAAMQREQALGKRVEGLKTDLFSLQRRTTKYNILRGDVETNRQLYDALLQRYKEIGVAGGVGVNNISIVDRAQVPGGPSSPRLSFNLAIALMLGLVAGLGLAFLLEQLEDTISDPSEVRELLGMVLIGVIPKVTEDAVGSLRDPKSSLSEAYFSAVTSLALSTDHGFPRTLMVTSSRPGEGKSLTSYGLAKTLAVSGRNVLLIDSDMRSPSVHHMVDCPLTPGLSNILAGNVEVAATIRQTAVRGLSAISAGPVPPSAAELLSGVRLPKLLSELLEQFDHVIIDSPPVMGFADAPLIASQVEGATFIIEAHATHKSMARAAVARLQGANTGLLGAIITKFDVERAHYGYGYNYGYGYGYGETAEGSNKR